MKKQENKTVRSLNINDSLYFISSSGIYEHYVERLSKKRSGIVITYYNGYEVFVENPSVTSFEGSRSRYYYLNYSKAVKEHKLLLKEKYHSLVREVNKANEMLNEFVNKYVLPEID